MFKYFLITVNLIFITLNYYFHYYFTLLILSLIIYANIYGLISYEDLYSELSNKDIFLLNNYSKFHVDSFTLCFIINYVISFLKVIQ